MTPPTQFPAAYLVELLDPYNGDVHECDVCAKVELAVEKVYQHLSQHSDVVVHVETSFDDDGELEGIGFFDESHQIISCITVYHLERDDADAEVASIAQACRAAPAQLEAALNAIFSF